MSTAQFALSYADPATCKLESKTMESLKCVTVSTECVVPYGI